MKVNVQEKLSTAKKACEENPAVRRFADASVRLILSTVGKKYPIAQKLLDVYEHFPIN